jgi:hypothetical protein
MGGLFMKDTAANQAVYNDLLCFGQALTYGVKKRFLNNIWPLAKSRVDISDILLSSDTFVS